MKTLPVATHYSVRCHSLSCLMLVILFALAALRPAAAEDEKPCPDLSLACPTHSEARLLLRKKKVTTLYQNLLYPTPLLINSGRLPVTDLFDSTNVGGRVTPLGQFPGFESAREYFYGLAATTRVENISFVSLVASGAKVGVQVNIFFCTQAQPCAGGPVGMKEGYGYTLTQTGFFTFNGADRIIAFDLSILNLGAAEDPATSADQEVQIQQTCALLTVVPNPQDGGPGTCGPTFADPVSYAKTNPLSNYQFDPSAGAFANCVGFMHSIPFGSWNRANSNTFVCRELHSLLTLYRPSVHCPHTSPAGGMTCIDFPYDSFYDTSFSTVPTSSMHHEHPELQVDPLTPAMGSGNPKPGSEKGSGQVTATDAQPSKKIRPQ